LAPRVVMMSRTRMVRIAVMCFYNFRFNQMNF
jgi:hypothetical protein